MGLKLFLVQTAEGKGKGKGTGMKTYRERAVYLMLGRRYDGYTHIWVWLLSFDCWVLIWPTGGWVKRLPRSSDAQNT